MRFLPGFLLLSVVMAAPAIAQDSTMTLNDVTFSRRISVEGHDMVLNGMALRKKFIIKVYVGGLYLPEHSTSAEQILTTDGPRRMVLQFIYHPSAKQMCGAWDESLEDNTPAASAELKQQFVTLCGYMEDVKKGEQFVFTYLPGRGTTVEVRGKLKGTILGKEFADALFKSWIGPKPGPGEDFKKKLLGVRS